MKKINIEISVEDFLQKLKDSNDRRPLLELIGRKFFIGECIELFLENGTFAKENYSIFNEILFDDNFQGETELEMWDEFWLDGLNKFPLEYLVETMLKHPPCYRSSKRSDATLDYLLRRYYQVSEVDSLNDNQIEELANLFDEFDEIPSELNEYKNKKEFENKLLEFEDLDYLNNNYTNNSYETKEIQELLCKVADSGKINKDNLNDFCIIIDWYAPKNMFDRKYRDTFVLSIFESNIGWTEDEYNIFDDYFYNINFDECAQMYQDIINQSYQDESDHISRQLKLNPNYRHD